MFLETIYTFIIITKAIYSNKWATVDLNLKQQRNSETHFSDPGTLQHFL